MNPETVSAFSSNAARLIAAGYSLGDTEWEWMAAIARETAALVSPGLEPASVAVRRVPSVGTDSNPTRPRQLVASEIHPEGWKCAGGEGTALATWLLVCPDGRGGALELTLSGREISPSPSPRARRAWALIAAHLGTALRLRHGAESGPSATPRDTLRDLVRTLGPMATMDPSRARTLWDALATGQLSLLDRFDHGARRYLVLRENGPDEHDPRALAVRESSVLERALRGDSNKAISYDLGISQSTVSGYLAGAMRKLGAASLLDLTGCFSGAPMVQATLQFAGEILQVVAVAAPRPPERAPLTRAEREIAADLLAGLSNHEIAQRRSRSERTVANQIVAVFRKYGINSRRELAVQLLAS